MFPARRETFLVLRFQSSAKMLRYQDDSTFESADELPIGKTFPSIQQAHEVSYVTVGRRSNLYFSTRISNNITVESTLFLSW